MLRRCLPRFAGTGWFRTRILCALMFVLILFTYTIIRRNDSRQTQLSTVAFRPITVAPSSAGVRIRTSDFRFYPGSRDHIEFARIQIDNDAETIFLVHETQQQITVDYSKPLVYSESIFRSAPIPIIWLDAHGDVRWNRAAHRETLTYLLDKQFPTVSSTTDNLSASIDLCQTRQLFILDQWPMGFFSRYHCFIEHFGQTLYSPSLVVLAPKRFLVSHSFDEDFHSDGILRYFAPFSICSAYSNHPKMKFIEETIRRIGNDGGTGSTSDTMVINNVHQLLERKEQTIKYVFSREIWKFGYDHVPHRRWLFDRNREQARKFVSYHSSANVLIHHADEHIYHYQSSSFNLSNWSPRNSPQGPPKDVLAGSTTKLSLNDQIFTAFLRYMILFFFSSFAPRIQISAKLLAHHWSEYLADKLNQPYNQSLNNMAVIFIRRGDKMPEDSFWQKHQRWRNISLYVKGLIDEEKRRQITYSSIFVMTDDVQVMNSIQNYAQTGLNGKNTDEPYARKHLFGRQILYNVFAPQSCFDPFIRIGFDQFLVNTKFVVDHAALVVGHTDSNVGRYLEELIYVKRQHQSGVQTLTHVINAPDTFD